MKMKNTILLFCLWLASIINAEGQLTTTCDDNKAITKADRANLGIVIYSNDAETVWNAFRLANFACSQKDTVKIFLLGKGVEAPNLTSEKFDVKTLMKSFVAAGGQILSCGTCLEIRKQESLAICPASTLADLYAIINKSEKIITF